MFNCFIYYETASQSLALPMSECWVRATVRMYGSTYKRVHYHTPLTEGRLSPSAAYLRTSLEAAAGGGGCVLRRLQRRYGRAGQGGTTNKQTDRQRQTDSVQIAIINPRINFLFLYYLYWMAATRMELRTTHPPAHPPPTLCLYIAALLL